MMIDGIKHWFEVVASCNFDYIVGISPRMSDIITGISMETPGNKDFVGLCTSMMPKSVFLTVADNIVDDYDATGRFPRICFLTDIIQYGNEPDEFITEVTSKVMATFRSRHDSVDERLIRRQFEAAIVVWAYCISDEASNVLMACSQMLRYQIRVNRHELRKFAVDIAAYIREHVPESTQTQVYDMLHELYVPELDDFDETAPATPAYMIYNAVELVLYDMAVRNEKYFVELYHSREIASGDIQIPCGPVSIEQFLEYVRVKLAEAYIFVSDDAMLAETTINCLHWLTSFGEVALSMEIGGGETDIKFFVEPTPITLAIMPRKFGNLFDGFCKAVRENIEDVDFLSKVRMEMAILGVPGTRVSDSIRMGWIVSFFSSVILCNREIMYSLLDWQGLIMDN